MSHTAHHRARLASVARCVVGAVLISLASEARAVDLDGVVEGRIGVNDTATASQQKIDGISAQTDEAIVEYRTANQRIEALRTYNRQMDQLLDSQQVEMDTLRREIDEVEVVAREVTPLMLAMIDSLEDFVRLDVPFLPEERSKRLGELRDLMRRSDITDAERYRRILEAYQIENEYGRTIEAYQGELDLGGQTRRVNFLRVGRVALMYQTLDATETGVWDGGQGAWSDANEFQAAVRKGLRVARKQLAPDLIRLPVRAAEAIQ